MGTSQQLDQRISALAATQNGVVARRQLRAAGIRPDAIRRRVLAGRLVELTPRVLLVAGAPLTDDARLCAAVLDAGDDAVVSHSSATALWRLPGFRIDPIQVIGRRGVAPDQDLMAVVHEPRRMRPSHTMAVNHIPVTTPTRTIFDLAGAPDVSAARLARLLDTAWSRRLVSHASLTAMLEQLAGKGRPGITLMRQLLLERPADHVPPESNTEARFEEIARLAGLRDLERQPDVGGSDGWIGRVDFLDRRRRVVFEVGDGLFHGSLTDTRHDEARWAELRAAGFTVEVVDAFDIFHRTDTLTARLRTIATTTHRSGGAGTRLAVE